MQQAERKKGLRRSNAYTEQEVFWIVGRRKPKPPSVQTERRAGSEKKNGRVKFRRLTHYQGKAKKKESKQDLRGSR